MVEEEERALRTMAAYIDLNPVRAGMVEDGGGSGGIPVECVCGSDGGKSAIPAGVGADHRANGMAEGGEGFRFLGSEGRDIAVEARPWGNEPFPKGVETRALVFYRAILGGLRRGSGRMER